MYNVTNINSFLINIPIMQTLRPLTFSRANYTCQRLTEHNHYKYDWKMSISVNKCL